MLRYTPGMSAFASKLPQRMTLAEYLAFEETATDRHEFHDGEVLAMSGGTRPHGRLTANLTRRLGERLDGTPCENYDSNMRIAVRETRRYVYPDATIVCGGAQFDPGDPKQTTIVNPRLVFEVLSPPTEAYDLGEKFDHYRRIPSREEYVVIAQREPTVRSFMRQADGTWSMQAWDGLDAVARIRCLEIDLPLAEVYAGVEFEGEATVSGT